MQVNIMQNVGSPLAQIGASGGSLSIVSCSRSWSGPFQNLGFGIVMSRICKTFSHIGPSSILISMLSVIAIMSIIISVTININNMDILRVWICNNSLSNFFISEVRRGYQRVCWPQCQGCSWGSCKMRGLRSFRSEPLAGHFPFCSTTKAVPDCFKT